MSGIPGATNASKGTFLDPKSSGQVLDSKCLDIFGGTTGHFGSTTTCTQVEVRAMKQRRYSTLGKEGIVAPARTSLWDVNVQRKASFVDVSCLADPMLLRMTSRTNDEETAQPLILPKLISKLLLVQWVCPRGFTTGKRRQVGESATRFFVFGVW